MSIRPAVASVCAALSIAIAVPAAAQGVEPGRRWALIVSGDREGPRNQSAREIAAVLAQNYGYGADALHVAPGATLGMLYSALNALSERVRRTDSLFVYLSARTLSLSRGKVIGEQILLSDSRETEPWTLLSLADLLDRVRAVGAGSTLLMLDDCLQVDSGYLSQRPSSPAQQSTSSSSASWPVRTQIQVITGCPAEPFARAAVEALQESSLAPGQRRLSPYQLATRMSAARKELRTSASGDGSFFFERVVAGSNEVLGRLTAGDEKERLAAIDELVGATLSDKSRSDIAGVHGAFLKLARNRQDRSSVRASAVRGMGLVAAPGVERDLASVLRDEADILVLTAGTSALERLRTPAAIRELELLVDAPLPLPRAAAIRALGRLESKSSLNRILNRLAIEQDTEPLIAGLEVVSVLAPESNPNVVTTVLDVARRPALDVSVDVAVVAALALLRSPRAEQLLASRIISDRPDAVRATAAVALAGLDLVTGTNREQVLIRALGDQSALVQESAAFAVGRLKARGAIPRLVRILGDLSEEAGVRAAAAMALGDIAPADNVEPLTAALKDRSAAVRRAAAAALGKSGIAGVLRALRDVEAGDSDPYVRSAASSAIQMLSQATELIDDDLASEQPGRRASAVARLPRSGRPDAVALLIARLADTDGQVAAAAVTELARMDTPGTTEALISELNRLSDTSETSARRRGAALALGQRQQTAALEALLLKAGDADPAVRAAVLSGLANFDDPRVIPALREAAENGNAVLRIAAADALTRHGNTLYTRQRAADAIAAFESALALHSEVLGTNDPLVAVDLNNIGVAMHSLGRYGEAEQRLGASLRIREEVLGPADLETATSLANLGLVYSSQKNYERAEGLFLRALKIRELVYGQDDATLPPLLDELVKMYSLQGRQADADAMAKRAASIRATFTVKRK